MEIPDKRRIEKCNLSGDCKFGGAQVGSRGWSEREAQSRSRGGTISCLVDCAEDREIEVEWHVHACLVRTFHPCL